MTTAAVQRRLPAVVRDVLPLWALTHLVGAALVLVSTGPGVRALDVQRFLSVDYRRDPTSPAFPPLWPGVLHLTGVTTGTAVAALAGLAGVCAVQQLSRDRDGAGASRWTVSWQLFAPEAAFLLVPYSEALFLALAPTAWLAATRGRWGWAGALGALAVLTRLTGLALAVGLLVLALLAGRTGLRRRWPVLLPFGAWAGWTAVLHSVTGRWDAVQHAQLVGWGREVLPPWKGASRTWALLRSGANTPEAVGELLALVALVVVTVVLLRAHRWAEAAYVGAQVLVFVCGVWHGGIGRGLLVTWPAWMLLGRWSARRPGLARPLLVASAVLTLLVTLDVLNGSFFG